MRIWFRRMHSETKPAVCAICDIYEVFNRLPTCLCTPAYVRYVCAVCTQSTFLFKASKEIVRTASVALIWDYNAITLLLYTNAAPVHLCMFVCVCRSVFVASWGKHSVSTDLFKYQIYNNQFNLKAILKKCSIWHFKCLNKCLTVKTESGLHQNSTTTSKK